MKDDESSTSHFLIKQEEYCQLQITKWEESEGIKIRPRSTPGPVELERDENPVDGGKRIRSVIGGLMYLARGTRPDIAFAVNYLARYSTKWGANMEKNLSHLLGYLKQNPGNSVEICNRRDDWEDLEIHIYADASFAEPRSTTGWLVFLVGPKGSVYLVDWQSKGQALATTSTAEAEITALATALKAGLRIGAMLDVTRKKSTRLRLFTDNESVRLAASRGHSPALAHLRKHAGLSLSFLRESGVDFVKVPGTQNPADILTKAVDRQVLNRLITVLQRPPSSSGQI